MWNRENETKKFQKRRKELRKALNPTGYYGEQLDFLIESRIDDIFENEAELTDYSHGQLINLLLEKIELFEAKFREIQLELSERKDVNKTWQEIVLLYGYIFTIKGYLNQLQTIIMS